MLRERKAKVDGSYTKWGGGRPPLMLCRRIKRGMKSVLTSAASSEVLASDSLSCPHLSATTIPPHGFMAPVAIQVCGTG